MNEKRFLLEEKGSVAVYAVAVILCFLTIIGGVFFSNSALRKNQLRTLLKIKDVYRQEVSQTDKILQERNNKNVSMKYEARDNLILHLDGINNAGNSHSQNTDIWKNLSNYGDSTTNNDGKLFNMKDQKCWRENSLHFDGIDDYVRISYNQNLSPNDYTIELVLSREDIVNNNRSIAFVKWQGYTVELNENKTLSFGTVSGEEYLKTEQELDLQKKYYITVTYNNSTRTQKIYINGQMISQKEISKSISHSSSDLTIGAWMNGNQIDSPFKGNIYAVRMYNRDLNEGEIQTNYNIDKERYGI